MSVDELRAGGSYRNKGEIKAGKSNLATRKELRSVRMLCKSEKSIL
jgi:hypothetical protein